MKAVLPLAAALALSGCLSVSNGIYRLEAYDPAGRRLLPDMQTAADGRNVYTVRNALCASLKGQSATIRIYRANNGEEVRSESSHRCR